MLLQTNGLFFGESIMANQYVEHAEIFDESTAHEILRDLEAQTSEESREKRYHKRLTAKLRVILQPGNSSDMLKLKLQGVTGDLSRNGMGAMFPLPIGVGDIFRLQFDKAHVNLPVIFARCIHCQMVSEDAYRTGFRFFTEIDIDQAFATDGPELLI